MKGITCVSSYQSLLLLFNIAIEHQEVNCLKITILLQVNMPGNENLLHVEF